MSYFAVWDSPPCLPTLGGVRVSICPTAGLACLADSSHLFQDGATSPPMCSDSVVNTAAHSFCNKKCQTGFSYVFPYSFLVRERGSEVVSTVTPLICEKANKKKPLSSRFCLRPNLGSMIRDFQTWVCSPEHNPEPSAPQRDLKRWPLMMNVKVLHFTTSIPSTPGHILTTSTPWLGPDSPPTGSDCAAMLC